MPFSAHSLCGFCYLRPVLFRAEIGERTPLLPGSLSTTRQPTHSHPNPLKAVHHPGPVLTSTSYLGGGSRSGLGPRMKFGGKKTRQDAKHPSFPGWGFGGLLHVSAPGRKDRDCPSFILQPPINKQPGLPCCSEEGLPADG